MTEVKHTRGPWELEIFHDGSFVISFMSNEIVGGNLKENPIIGEKEMEANVMLMTVATELRVALVNCIGFISGEDSNTEIDRKEVLEIARAAIASVNPNNRIAIGDFLKSGASMKKKELWQMTDQEYIRWKRKNLTDEQKKRWKEKTDRAVVIKDRVTEQWREEHVEIVHRALSDGELVPENVIAEHPEIREAPSAFECAAVTDGDGKLFDRYGAGRYSCRLPGGIMGLGTTPLEALREARRKERQGPTQKLLEAATIIMEILDHRDGMRCRQDLITKSERDHLRKAIALFD